MVAIFAVYQTFPQGIMAHKSRGFSKIADVFYSPGILAAEDDTWLRFCAAKFASPQVKIVGYSGGVAAFLTKSDYSQQCFVTSEPLVAAAQGGDPQTFLIAEAGYNPYTTVVITRGDTIKAQPDRVKAIVGACREGWRAYLDDPSIANTLMHQLNPDMDAATFAAAAEAQKPLIETAETKALQLGMMTADRWDTLAHQLVDLKVIKQAIPSGECFINP